MVYSNAEKEILAKVDETHKMVLDIKTVIAGQPEYGQKGLKHTIEEHGTRLGALEDRMDKRDKNDFKAKVAIAAVSGVSGASAGWGSKWLMATKVGAAIAAFLGIK